MTLRVFNTLTREKEQFTTVVPGQVGIYLCGPTVYKPPHIGHMVGPVIFDAIKRYLIHRGFKVKWIVNITDVDDKLIEAANKRQTTVELLATKYTAEYMECLRRFGIDSIDDFPKASQHIGEIVQLCQRLIASGYAYAVGGNVWFDVAKDADYGKLSNRKVEEQESGLRTLEGEGKRNSADFAVWKAAKDGEPAWDSPWGKGRPGWHIECSAMSMKYLGETLDIHGGGMDLMFPHHENELAQSESATGKTFAKYWLHNGLTRIKTKLSSGQWADEKMSGSIGNVVSATELLDTWGAEVTRYMLLSTHYRRPIEFTGEVLGNSKKGLSSFHRLFERIARLTGKPLDEKSPDLDSVASTITNAAVKEFITQIMAEKARFYEAMDDDFNTAAAIAVLHDWSGRVNSFIENSKLEPGDLNLAASAAAQSLRKTGQILGLFNPNLETAKAKEPELLDQVMKLLIQIRNDARGSKNFALADSVRKGLQAIGIVLEDRPEGTEWKKT